MRKAVKRWMKFGSALAVVLCCLVIWRFSLDNGAQSSSTSGALLQEINSALSQLGFPAISHKTVRKMAHFAEFFVLGLLLSFCLWLHGVRHAPWRSASAVLAVATVDELLQLLSPGRTPHVKDVLLDLAGGACGVLVFCVFLRLARAIFRHKKKKVKKLDKTS